MSNFDDALKQLHQTVIDHQCTRFRGELEIRDAAAAATDALRSFNEAWADATRRHEVENLYLHPDLVALDLDDAYWRTE